DGLRKMVIPDHVGHLQILMVNRVILAHQRRCGFMVEIPPLSPDLLVRFGEQFYRLTASVTPFYAPRNQALTATTIGFAFAVGARVMDHRPFGQGGERFYPQVDPSLLAGGRQGLYWHLGTGKADIPTVGFPRDGDGLGHTFQRT